MWVGSTFWFHVQPEWLQAQQLEQARFGAVSEEHGWFICFPIGKTGKFHFQNVPTPAKHHQTISVNQLLILNASVFYFESYGESGVPQTWYVCISIHQGFTLQCLTTGRGKWDPVTRNPFQCPKIYHQKPAVSQDVHWIKICSQMWVTPSNLFNFLYFTNIAIENDNL